METETRLVRSSRDRELPRSILEPQEKASHRPRTAYRLQIRTADDARRARAVGLPVFALTDSMVTMLGYPMHFPPLVLVPRGLRSAVETDLPVVEFLSEDAVREPRFEDVVVALLQFDSLAARALAERNKDLLDESRLLKRILQEDLEAEATRVRFRDLLPFLPERGKPLPRAALERAISKNLPGGALP